MVGSKILDAPNGGSPEVDRGAAASLSTVSSSAKLERDTLQRLGGREVSPHTPPVATTVTTVDPLTGLRVTATDQATAQAALTNANEAPLRLVQEFLSGRLSQGELAHKLRSFNSVVADQMIKDGKKAPTSAVSYNEVARATMNRPGGISPEPPEKSQPKKGCRGYGPGQPDEDQAKEMREKEEKQEQQQQQRQRVQVDNQVREDLETAQIQAQHLEAEEERRKEEEELDLGLSGIASLDAFTRTTFGGLGKAKQAASPDSLRRELAQKMLELHQERSLSETEGAEHEDR